MFKKSVLLLSVGLALAACASEKPRIVQSSGSAEEVRLHTGMATQIEMPNSNHVQSVIVGNPALVTADRVDNIVNLVPKGGSGETNLIVRSTDADGDTKVYQYRVVVQDR